MADVSLGTYAYCVLAGAAPALEEMPGVDSAHPVRALRHEDLTALTSGVSLAEYGAEPLKRNLNDVRWLERTARAHQRVLDRAMTSGTIVPLRLCTVFTDDAGVRAMLEREHDVLAAALARLAGREEWGVKLIAEPGALREAARRSAELAARGDPAGAGHAYVARVRADRAARDAAQRIGRECAKAVHGELRARAVAARVLRRPPRELSGDAGEVILNGAYLIESGDVSDFRALAGALAEREQLRGLKLEITGPWAPYSFVAEQAHEQQPSRARVR